jgi:hypothetical protein
LPLIAFVFLVVLLVMLVGIACVCATDHPMQTIERALSSIPAAAAVLEIWTYAVAAIMLAAFVAPARRLAVERASPQELQRFLF